MICDFECIRKWTMYITYFCSAILIGLGVAKFFSITAALDVIDYIINVYLILLGLIMFFCECGWERILKHFNFLRYYLGKCLFTAL